ncbi:leucine-rich repeat and immunoglobulin-like domain containing-NOGO receptor-interacting protein 4 isoform X3 [Leguminivora glycinivorella]|uniref:leucine-rich repeat and immunoglobulin-like domain containing-NOGO receptor-interacting protein 4 isoform X3 n=1 Tax=Leguminivora glycinivorella TaxID=1035111 RepID=UPI002010A0FB|nr:leucine-rich repeat and immunoglobulin-like domain containing-NOGO receptor-interacting protein 4 isoform X3 [Leguminivora glycinivorella]
MMTRHQDPLCERTGELHENYKQRTSSTNAVKAVEQGVRVMVTAWQVSRRVANVLTSNAFIVVLISLELLAWRSGAAALANCPSGCSCNDETLVVVCEESRLDVLPIALNPSIQRLIIRNNKIKTIDSSMQFYAELQHLDLSQNHLVNIPTKSFAYQRKLQELHLNHNKISSVTNTTFQGLNALTVLNLKRNFLEELTNGVFSTLPRLEELNLGQNRISRIEPKAFAGLTALRILYLDDNQLSSVPTMSFSLLGSLAELHVGLNAFSYLPDDTFAGLNRLAVLDLNGAGLFNISENAFRGLPGLRSLNLFGNRLSVVPTQQIGGLTRLEELYIGQNDFMALESHSFKGLKNLKLLDITGAAQLERVEKGAFEDNINLETVVLANNKKLSVIEEGTLLGLPKLKHVTLRDNAIASISETVFVGKELRQLDITDNPIVCDCQLLWLHELLNEKSNFTQIQCAEPLHLKDKYLRTITADGLGCAVHDTRQQTIICVVVVACVAFLASLVLVLYRYRKSMHEKLKDYKWNKRAMRKDLEYHKPISTEEDCILELYASPSVFFMSGPAGSARRARGGGGGGTLPANGFTYIGGERALPAPLTLNNGAPALLNNGSLRSLPDKKNNRNGFVCHENFPRADRYSRKQENGYMRNSETVIGFPRPRDYDDYSEPEYSVIAEAERDYRSCAHSNTFNC